MGKAILVIDMPKSCQDCMARSLADDCQVMHRDVIDYRYSKSKPEWCPLVLLPGYGDEMGR